jgi:hypothetical protein
MKVQPIGDQIGLNGEIRESSATALPKVAGLSPPEALFWETLFVTRIVLPHPTVYRIPENSILSV